jgi:hypothetical protein
MKSKRERELSFVFTSFLACSRGMSLIDRLLNTDIDPDYTLPPSLKATPTQTLVPHSAIFDGIIFPSLRDRLILLKDQYPLEELTKDLVGGLSIHGNDLLLAENWEVDESFLRKYW